MVKRAATAPITEEDEDDNINENGQKSGNLEGPETKKKFRTKSLYRQPTVKELTRLNEAETLFNSNLFRLQIEEILQEVKVKEKTEKKIEEWFENFQTNLKTIKINDTEYDLSENTLFKELKVKSPLPANLSKTKCMFTFHKFENIKIVGSYRLGCAINSNLILDIEIKVPAETYTKNDSINYKYHKKRAAYLACIASHLKNSEDIEDLKYSWLNGVLHSPILEGKPSGKIGSHISVRIHLSCSEEAYKLQRFSPSRNNLRESWLFNSVAAENETGPPTPYYNNSILKELTAGINSNHLTEILANNDNLKNAIVLLKIWLRQRGLNVSGFIISMFVAYLVQLKRINNLMSSYQIVRNVWVALKSSKWDTEGISLNQGTESPNMSEFLQQFPVVFLDVTGFYNICYQMSQGTYAALKRDSGLSVEMLDNGSINSFIPLFMVPARDLERFDHIIRFKDPESIIDKVYNTAHERKKLNYGIDKVPLAIDIMLSMLSEGLGDRVFLSMDRVKADFSCSIKQKLEKAMIESNYKVRFEFGFVLNPENALNIVLKGPPANLPEAEKFRAFWGDKSELRRFQDGSITETCVWEGDSLAQKRTLTKQIVQYLLHLKYGVKPEETFYVADQLDPVLMRKHMLPSDGVIGTGEELSLKVIKAFDELRRDLRGLTELPLDISSVYGTSPILSYCDPLPMIGLNEVRNPWLRDNACLIKDTGKDGVLICPDYTPVYEAVIEMTHSGKWPGELEAFRCLKAAFYIQICERLTQQYSVPTHPYHTHLDVVKNGVVFRLRIVHSKELTLIRRQVEGGVVKHRESAESVTFMKDGFLLPKLRGALHGLHQSHPSFGPTVCLAKRWLNSQLIDDHHFPDTVIELLVAHVFLHPEPYTAPMQPLCGFVRLLRLIVGTDWMNDMILIDFHNELKAEEKAEIERKFSEADATSRPPLFIVTSYDSELASVWSEASPNKMALARARALATATLAMFDDRLMDNYDDNILGAFIPSLTGYDVTIHLHPNCVTNSAERIDKLPTLRRYKEVEGAAYIPVVGFEPVTRYLQELRNAYSDFAVFFYDTYGGEVIGVLWKPHVDEAKEFQVATANATMPITINKETKYAINKSAILEDFKILGEGIVKEVIVCEV